MDRPDGVAPVLGIIGGCGGSGATALAAAVAAVAGSPASGPAVLIDLDALGGGIDVALAEESVPGARWSGLHATGARLDPAQLLDGLPRWRSVLFLACDRHVWPAADAVRSVLRAARLLGPVVIDLGRAPTPARSAALAELAAIALVVPAEIRAVTAAAAIRAQLADDGFRGEIRAAVRRDRGVISARRIADVLDVTLAGVVPRDRGLGAERDRGIDPRRLRRGTRSLARELLEWSASLPDRAVTVAEQGPVESASVASASVASASVASVASVASIASVGSVSVESVRPEFIRGPDVRPPVRAARSRHRAAVTTSAADGDDPLAVPRSLAAITSSAERASVPAGPDRPSPGRATVAGATRRHAVTKGGGVGA